jgi:hypothetical protein
MLYQLPNGKVIEISTEQFIEMSDEELEYLIAYNYGEVLENPWFGSVLSKKDSSTPEPVQEINDLIDIPEEQKLSDLDVDFDLTEE